MVLVIGYGNSLRRDDGAGVRLVEQAERACRGQYADVCWVTTHQLTPELAEDVAAEAVSAVVFVDAAAPPPGATRVDTQLCPIGVDESHLSIGHHLRPEALMAYARFLYSRQRCAWLLTVPGTDFGLGEGLSEQAQQALEGGQKLLLGLLTRLCPPQDCMATRDGVPECGSI